jgi:hypothetical protein
MNHSIKSSCEDESLLGYRAVVSLEQADQITRRFIPEGSHRLTRRRENLKSHNS